MGDKFTDKRVDDPLGDQLYHHGYEDGSSTLSRGADCALF